jgi:hypothetical protein
LPRDFSKEEQTELRKLTREMMLKVPELWKPVMEGGKLNEAIKALSKEISKEKAVPHRILQQLLSRDRTDSRYNEKRRNKGVEDTISEEGKVDYVSYLLLLYI